MIMLKAIVDEVAIRRCQRQLAQGMRASLTDRYAVRLGHPGASVPARVSWAEKLGIWFCFRKAGGDCYGNAFGIRKPGGHASLSITCEINVPLRGVDRRFGGVFAEDGEGRIFLAHRGRIGGGRKGVGKTLFERYFRGIWTSLDDGDGRSTVAVVGMLRSPRLSRQVGQFVRRVDRIKRQAHLLAARQIEIFEDMAAGEEFTGRGVDAAPPDLQGLSDYGIVLQDLADALARHGRRVRSDSRRDLAVVDATGRVTALFQVSADSSEAGFSTAMARLLVDGADAPHGPALILLLPGVPPGELADRLARLGIAVAAYAWDGDTAVFPGIEDLLPGTR
jgi:hypothetical protein